MTLDQFLVLIHDAAIVFMPCGSRFTCDPPPMDTDIDYLALITDEGTKKLENAGFSYEVDLDSYDELSDFVSFRSGLYNVIATPNAEFYAKFKMATFIAKKRNILDKDDRIALFQNILYGVTTHEQRFQTRQ